VDRRIEELLARQDVAAARAWIESHDAQTIANQRTIAMIPAPTFDEGQRGAWIAEKLIAIGLDDVRTDEVGNVIARYGDGAGPGIVVCSHLDTVFPGGTPVDAWT
jgi:tripeptide aminopeptidase